MAVEEENNSIINAPRVPEMQPTADPSEEQTAKGTVEIGGVIYAVGLMWQPLQNPENPAPEIRDALEAEPDGDLYCLRSTIAPQYGIGKKVLGHRDGMPSLAASVASALSDKESVCAVFRIKEGWFFTAIRNDLILSEEDALYETKEDAQRAFFAMMAVPDWDLKIVPEDWSVDGSTELPLDELVKRAPKTRLVELTALKRTSVLFLIALFVIFIVAGLIWTIVSWWETVFPQEKIVALPTPDVIKPLEPAPEKPKPWEKVPQTDVFLNKCWNNAYQLNTMTIPGWELGSVVCTPKGIETGWSKSWGQGGRIAWLKSAINEYKISKINITLSDTGTSATGSISFSDIPLVASVPTLTVSQIREDLIDISQATGLPINFQEQTVLDPPTAPDGTVPPNQQTYHYFQFSIVSAYTPWEWKVFFDKFTGLELLKIEYNPSVESTTKWKYEGRIYAK